MRQSQALRAYSMTPESTLVGCAVLPESVAVRGARLVPAGRGWTCLPLGPRRVGHLRAEPAARAGATYSVRSSSSKLDGRRILDAPPRYLAQVKTDCLLTQRLPKRFTERLEALATRTAVHRVEETRPLLGSSRAPRMEAERPKGGGTGWTTLKATAWRATPCCSGPGAGKTHLARTIVARLREQGEAVHLVSKTHCSAQNLGLGAQTADHWARRYVRGGSVVEEIAQLDGALGGPGLCDADVKFLLLGDFRQLPAVLDSWAGRPISVPLEHSQLIRDLATGTSSRRTCAPTPASSTL